jgi:hypothetical protein
MMKNKFSPGNRKSKFMFLNFSTSRICYIFISDIESLGNSIIVTQNKLRQQVYHTAQFIRTVRKAHTENQHLVPMPRGQSPTAESEGGCKQRSLISFHPEEQ